MNIRQLTCFTGQHPVSYICLGTLLNKFNGRGVKMNLALDGKLIGMAYAIIALLILACLFRKDKYNKKIGYMFLIVSTTLGFLIFAPMLPHQLQTLVIGKIGGRGSPLPLMIVGLLLFMGYTLMFGRLFCGFICPIGAIQELAYKIPTKKKKIAGKALVLAFQVIFFILFIVLGIFSSIAILSYFGFEKFFHLDIVSPFFYVFIALLLISVFIYRPFCRLFCPYGLLLSLFAVKSIFKLRRNDKCIDCNNCEDACPTSEAGREDLKRECYMCNRCREACAFEAIDYRKK
jgi:polyferredoxin